MKFSLSPMFNVSAAHNTRKSDDTITKVVRVQKKKRRNVKYNRKALSCSIIFNHLCTSYVSLSSSADAVNILSLLHNKTSSNGLSTNINLAVDRDEFTIMLTLRIKVSESIVKSIDLAHVEVHW